MEPEETTPTDAPSPFEPADVPRIVEARSRDLVERLRAYVEAVGPLKFDPKLRVETLEFAYDIIDAATTHDDEPLDALATAVGNAYGFNGSTFGEVVDHVLRALVAEGGGASVSAAATAIGELHGLDPSDGPTVGDYVCAAYAYAQTAIGETAQGWSPRAAQMHMCIALAMSTGRIYLPTSPHFQALDAPQFHATLSEIANRPGAKIPLAEGAR